MKKMYIVTYHNGEYEDSVEFNLVAFSNREDAEFFIEEIIEYWDNPEYPPYLNFLLNPEIHSSLRWMGIQLDENAFDVQEIPFLF
ncbi:MAG: hypothetical protein J6T10_32030 [Methanobrevibacter sp.]|nr:hypothetical protein [Methanobrevibacter sp.]